MGENHGHKTLIDGTTVALTKDEAEALWQAIEAEDARRTDAMPTARDALVAMMDAEMRMRDLGWAIGGGLKVKRGDECAVAQQGSTGMWRGWLDEDRKYVHFGDCVASPDKVWLKPLADLTPEERAHMDYCDKREAEAYSALLDRLALQDASHDGEGGENG